MEANEMVCVSRNLVDTVKKMESSDKSAVISAASKYITAKRSCADLRPSYYALLQTIRQLESKYGFAAFGENVSELDVINEFASKVEVAIQTVTGSKRYSCSFPSLEAANAWLLTQTDIIPKSFQANTTHAGLQITQVRIDYMVCQQRTNRIFQLSQETKVRFFFGSDPEKYRRKWERKHSQWTFLASIKRRWGFSLIGGSVGFFRFIKEKYIVLYATSGNYLE